MSNAKDTPADSGDTTAGSPYDDAPTEAIAVPRGRKPKPDNDDFFDRHGRRPSPGVSGAIADKAARDAEADGPERPADVPAGSPADESPTETIETSPQIARDQATGKAAPQRIEPTKRASRWGRRSAARPGAASEAADLSANETDAIDDAAGQDETEALDLTSVPDDGDAKTAVIINSDDSESAQRPPVTMSSSDDPVRTEPFADPDDGTGTGSDDREGGRRYAEHLTQAPLPYIEPQPTTPLETDDGYDDLMPPADSAEAFDPQADTPVGGPVGETSAPRRGTLDLGLLILRVVVGLTFTVHGLQKLTGWMNGPGLDGFADFLANKPNPGIGFTDAATMPLAIVASVCETAGGVLMVLGLFTPIAGSALLGSILVAMTYKVTLAGGLWFFSADGGGNGIELEVMLAAAAGALILTGPGTYSIDRMWGWSRRPAWGSAACLVIAIAAAVAMWIVFNGANPLSSWSS